MVIFYRGQAIVGDFVDEVGDLVDLSCIDDTEIPTQPMYSKHFTQDEQYSGHK